MTQNVVLAVNTSAAARTPEYFSMTGAAATAVVASSGPPRLAAFLGEVRRGLDRVDRGPDAGSDVRHVLLVQGDVVAGAEPAEVSTDEVLPRVGERGGGRLDVPGDVFREVAEVDRRPARVDDVHEHQRVVIGQVDEDVVRRGVGGMPGEVHSQ